MAKSKDDYESMNIWLYKRVKDERDILRLIDAKQYISSADYKIMGEAMKDDNHLRNDMILLVASNEEYNNALDELNSVGDNRALRSFRRTSRSALLSDAERDLIDAEDIKEEEIAELEEDIVKDLLNQIDDFDTLRDIKKFNNKKTIVINNLTPKSQDRVREAFFERSGEIEEETTKRIQTEYYEDYLDDYRRGKLGDFTEDDIEYTFDKGRLSIDQFRDLISRLREVKEEQEE